MLCCVKIKMCQKRQETNPSKEFSVPVNPELFCLASLALKELSREGWEGEPCEK